MELDTASSDTDDFSDGSSLGGEDTLNPSRLLQNALRHIDGLIENCEENKRHSICASESKLLVLSTELRIHIEELEQQLQCDIESDVPEETLKVIYNWSKRQLGVQTSEDEVVRLRKELKAEKEKHKQLTLAEAEVKRLHVKLQSHEFETQRLQEICDRLEDELRQKEKPKLTAKGRKRSISDLRDVNKPSKMQHSTSVPEIQAYNLQAESMPNLLESSADNHDHHQEQRRKSSASEQARKGWVSKLFGRHRVRSHENKAASGMLETEPLFNLPVQNERAQLFYTLEEDGLLVWIQEMGLNRYTQGIIRHAPSGADLVKLVTSHQEHLAGITHPLHKKKLQLAIKDALAEQASVTSHLDYHWVADWLIDIGLPQYRDSFMESLVDGNILNQITYDDLSVLQVTNTFHQISLKRAVQGLRLASYRKNYLRTWSSVKGANQVLLWPASRVSDWLKRIDLGDYTGHLEGSGLHGALMVLEVTFTEESLARLLGIPPGKVFLRKHLLRRFLDIVGPVVAQSKIDAQQVKNFTALDPIGKSKADRKKLRHKKDSTSGNDTALCPFDLGVTQQVARQISRSSPEVGAENAPPKHNLIE